MGRITPHYGVEPNCNYKSVKTVRFRGDGFIEFKSHTLGQHSSLGISFKTKQASKTFHSQISNAGICFIKGRVREIRRWTMDIFPDL